MIEPTAHISHPPQNSAVANDPVRCWRRLWRDGGRPELRPFLAAHAGLESWQVLALLRIDQRERWLTGERVLLEDYLELQESLRDDTEQLLDLVYGEFLLREQLGETPDVESYAARFPQLAGQLRLQIEVHRLIALSPGQRGPTDEVLPHIPGYRVLSPLGRGGMAVVYKAWQDGLERVVALKMIDARGRFDAEQRARFRSEAALAAGLQHPNIVQVYDVGEHEGWPYFSLEYVDGGNLAQCFGGRPQPSCTAAALVATLARAMAYAHQRGVVHRDLKPANILLASGGRKPPESAPRDSAIRSGGSHPPLADFVPKIADFGLAKYLDNDLTRTRSGAILGTPSYMAPEQASGQAQRIGPATDIHALGVLLYELLTGRPPFTAATTLEILEQVRTQEALPPSQLDVPVPRDLETVCLKCLEKEPSRRYASANDLADDLDRFLQHRPVRARPVGPMARLLRWCRRNPTLATLSITVIASLLAGLSLSSFFALDAREQAGAAQTQAKEARQAREMADRRLYVADMRRAQFAWEQAQVGHVQDLLERQRPEHTGDIDLRGFEWHYWRRQCQASHRTLRGHTSWIRDVAFSPDGRRVASAGQDGTVRIWETATGREVRTLRDAEGTPVQAVAFSLDGRHLASGDRAGLLRIWNAGDGQLRVRCRGHTERILSVAFSPDSRCIASTSHDKTIRLWDSGSGAELHTLLGHTEQVYGVSFHPDGQTLVSASKESVLRVWDRHTGQERQRWPTPFFHAMGVSFSPDGSRLAAVGTSYAPTPFGGSWLRRSAAPLVQIFDTMTGQVVGDLRGHDHVVTGVAFHPDGRLATCGADQTIRLWDSAQGQLLRTFRGHTALVWRIAFSPNGRQLSSVSEDGTIKLWDVGPETLSYPGHEPRWLYQAAFSPDGRFLASVGGEPKLIIRDGTSGAVRHTLTDPAQRELTLAFSPDSRQLATGGYQHVIHLWDPESGRLIDTLRGHTDRVQGLAFSRDGRWLASVSLDRTVRLWDARTRQLERTMTGHTDSIYVVAFSTDGRLVASSGRDQTVRIWEATTGKPILTFAEHRPVHQGLSILLASAGHGLAFSPDGLLASAVQDRRVLLWEPTTGRIVRTFQGHTDAVNHLTFTPDGKRLATTSEDQTVRLWETASGEETLTIRSHARSTTSVFFSPDGHRLVSGDAGGNLYVWDATPLPEPASGDR